MMKKNNMPDKPIFTITEIEKQMTKNYSMRYDGKTFISVGDAARETLSTLRRYIEGKEQQLEEKKKTIPDSLKDVDSVVVAITEYNHAIDAILEGLRSDKENL